MKVINNTFKKYERLSYGDSYEEVIFQISSHKIEKGTNQVYAINAYDMEIYFSRIRMVGESVWNTPHFKINSASPKHLIEYGKFCQSLTDWMDTNETWQIQPQDVFAFLVEKNFQEVFYSGCTCFTQWHLDQGLLPYTTTVENQTMYGTVWAKSKNHAIKIGKKYHTKKVVDAIATEFDPDWKR